MQMEMEFTVETWLRGGDGTENQDGTGCEDGVVGRDGAEGRHLCIGRDRVLGRKMEFCVGMGVTVERRSWMVRMPWINVLLLMERLLSTHGTQ